MISFIESNFFFINPDIVSVLASLVSTGSVYSLLKLKLCFISGSREASLRDPSALYRFSLADFFDDDFAVDALNLFTYSTDFSGS